MRSKTRDSTRIFFAVFGFDKFTTRFSNDFALLSTARNPQKRATRPELETQAGS
jgi:hypothetical protein